MTSYEGHVLHRMCAYYDYISRCPVVLEHVHNIRNGFLPHTPDERLIAMAASTLIRSTYLLAAFEI